MSKYSILLVTVLLTGLIILPRQMHAQNKPHNKSALNKMNPIDMEKRLKELGISREEAVKQASLYNIDLEEFLNPVSQYPSAADSLYKKTGPFKDSRFGEKKDHQLAERMEIDSIVPGFSERPPAVNLKPFGYSIFQYPQSTFEPILDAATPSSYTLGPGDEVVIAVWGDTKLYYQLPVNREGNILVPDIGPVSAGGTTVPNLKDKLIRQMTAVYSSLRNGGRGATSFLDVSLAKIRTIQIFVLGEVRKPGGYSLSSLSTALHALYLSEGPSINGSLRNIQIVRSGNTAGVFDFYDYALRADNSKDIHLQDGDIVFVKPVGTRAAITGNVLRPGIYEIKENENLGTLIGFAGGLRFDAYFERIHIERLIPFDERKKHSQNFLDFDVHFNTYREAAESKFEIQNGDIVSVYQVGSIPENRVIITGNVKKSGTFQLKSGMRIKDLLYEADSLDRNTFTERGTLFRMLANLRREIISFNPRLAFLDDPENNIELKNEDSLVIYKESQFFPEHTVSVGGAVRKPGTYPRHENMTIADLVVMAGGLTENASKYSWELSRLDTTRIGSFSTIRKFNVQNEYWEEKNGESSYLEDFDHLMVPSNPKYNKQRVVEIHGYVLYPGSYALSEQDERLSSLINRAGGLRPGAYLEGSTLVRKWNNAGLVPIDFEKALDDTESSENIKLLAGDSIMISFQQEVVKVRGEVFVQAAVVHKKGASLDYYIEQAGGMTDEADEDRIVVILPNGRRWEDKFYLFSSNDILGGSTVYVPKKIETKTETLAILRDWATIIASLAAITIGIVQITK
ncbi:MAG: SLBB domain-containing protein [Bacteroidetes bacterium]|nr:SLBB domain-containing protein [Bacteroidota bacterium]